LCRVQKAVAQFRVHAGESSLAEIDCQGRKIVLGQRIELHGFVELAGEDRRRVVFDAVEHASL
jgi:hypothetical protein